MRIISVACLSLSVAFLTACGGSQPEKVSRQSMDMQNESQVVAVEKQDVSDMSANGATTEIATSETATTETGHVNEGIEDLKVQDEATDATIVTTTSDNAMMNDNGINPAGNQMVEEQSMEAMEGDKKEIAKQKETSGAEVTEPKS